MRDWDRFRKSCFRILFIPLIAFYRRISLFNANADYPIITVNLSHAIESLYVMVDSEGGGEAYEVPLHVKRCVYCHNIRSTPSTNVSACIFPELSSNSSPLPSSHTDWVVSTTSPAPIIVPSTSHRLIVVPGAMW